MAIKLTTTAQSSDFVKCLVYGRAGVGKTVLSDTAPTPLIISAEQGLLSLKDKNIPVIMIEDHIDFEDAYNFITTNEKAKGFETIVLDSISDIAEAVLAYFKKNPIDGNTHPQAAYGSMADVLLPLIKQFRDLPGKHVYFIAKSKRVKDDYTGITSWLPSMPGQQLGPALPYLFDFVLPMRIGETDKGVEYRYLQTKADIQWEAKDRSGKLNTIEEPNLTKLFNKALGITTGKEKIAEAKMEPPQTKIEGEFNSDEESEEGDD